ncbi:hypothetical protein [Lacticaseibacillus paracasei]|uniref:hypothetical protein n=1 Tax=Lacticaseibacillus paracasei TaxID=1597 RepID=UPI0021C3F0FB|nr:hypothetical protein [Lacticaseibacillus paracasei]MCP9304616.1 hypothetical protein [Lacticaseibacillus paracasei]
MECLQIESLVPELNPKAGQSHPIMIVASDQQKYFLKRQMVRFENKKNNAAVWINENAVFFQESLVSQIARRLKIPTPETAIIHIDKLTLKAMTELQFKYHISEGYYFATKMISDNDSDVTRLANNLLLERKAKIPYAATQWNALMKKIINTDDIPKIIGLDLFTLNYDRFSNIGNVLLQKAGINRYLIAIDFGHCFASPCWADPNSPADYTKKLEILHQNLIDFSKPIEVRMLAHNIVSQYNVLEGNNRIYLGLIFDSLVKLLDFTAGNPFTDIVDAIESISDPELVAMLQATPDEWIITPGTQQQEYKEFLLRQRFMVRPIINELADAKQFPTIHGREELSWPTELNTNIQ